MGTRKEHEEMLAEVLANKEISESIMHEQSKAMFFRMDSLTRSGFTEEQSFQIVLQRGLS